jgi:hypothetical protein
MQHEDRLHVLVNNAGATWGAPMATFPESAWDKVMYPLARPPLAPAPVVHRRRPRADLQELERIQHLQPHQGLHPSPSGAEYREVSRAVKCGVLPRVVFQRCLCCSEAVAGISSRPTSSTSAGSRWASSPLSAQRCCGLAPHGLPEGRAALNAGPRRTGADRPHLHRDLLGLALLIAAALRAKWRSLTMRTPLTWHPRRRCRS